MSKKPEIVPSDAELEILQVLWEEQPASVRSVHESLAEKREVGYTTILKQMQRMLDKGLLRRTKDGKQHLYEAVAAREEIQRSLTDRLVNKAFSGSAMQMVMRALGQGKTSAEELEALQKWLDQQKNQDDA